MSERLIEKLQNRASYCSAKGQEHCTDLMGRSADLLARLVGMKERLREMGEALTCLESRDDHPACDYCGEVVGIEQRAAVRDLLALIAEVDR